MTPVRTPVALLIAFTGASFGMAIITGVNAAGKVEEATSGYGGLDAAALRDGASLAAASNIWLTLGGVGLIGLLMVWAVVRIVWSRLPAPYVIVPGSRVIKNP